jgi:hypothetical protein
VLCPGAVDTHLDETELVIGMTPERAEVEAEESGVFHTVVMTPDQIGEIVVEAVRQDQFFILPDRPQQSVLLKRTQDLNAFLEARLPASPLPP